MFITHFVRGLGFPLHPFVRGLMFYYVLDFHDLAPNSILNISAFICRVRGPPSHRTSLRPMAEDLQFEVEGGERPTSGVRRRHGGKDAQCHMAQRLFCGNREEVAIGVVLHHRAARHQLGGGSRILVRSPDASHLLARERPDLIFLG